MKMIHAAKVAAIVVLICIKYGVNPFKATTPQKDRLRKMSEKDKQWILNHCVSGAEDYFEEILY